MVIFISLRKLAHTINRDFLALKIENFQLNNSDIFLIFAQNIDCGYSLEPPRRGGSNEYPQSMFWSKNKKNRYTLCIPQVYYMKVGFKGVYITRTCFPDVCSGQFVNCLSVQICRHLAIRIVASKITSGNISVTCISP